MYRDEDRPEEPEDDEMGMMPAYDSYVTAKMAKPEYRRIKIGLDRVERSLGAIASGSGHMNKERTLTELMFVLGKLQETEMLAEKVDDAILWEFIVDYIEMLEDIRRHMVAEVRWELESDRRCPAEV